MRIDAISSRNTNYKGLGSKLGKTIEGTAATLETSTSKKRKTISIELHNALVKLTAYRVALLFSALSGFVGYQAADKISDNETEDFANTVQAADIDTTAQFQVKDVTYDGCADLVLQKKDGTTMVLDLKNSNVLMESTGFKEVK